MVAMATAACPELKLLSIADPDAPVMGRFDDYGGILTAYPYAARASESWLFRAYVVVSAFVTLFVTLIFVTGLVDLIAATAAAPGGSLTLSRTFYVVLNLLVVLPVVAPVLFVAYRHRRETGVAARYDQAMASSGFVYMLAVYVGVVTTTPPAHQEAVGALGRFLYDLPAEVGMGLALVAALGVYATHRALSG
jgi:hypothetical protein